MHNKTVIPMRQTNHAKEIINGARMMPQGYRTGECIPNFNDAYTAAKRLEKEAKDGSTFNVSGVAGSYHIIRYEKKLVADPAYN